MRWLACALLCWLTAAQKRALLIIDVQYDFLPEGSLAVPAGEEVIPVINNIRNHSTFDLVVFTQDWHTPAHVSFASSHPGSAPFSVIELAYTADGSLCSGPNISPAYSISCEDKVIKTRLNQTLWPDHCVQNSTGAELHPSLLRTPSDLIVRKGYHAQIDSYSAFWDNGHVAATDLQPLLKSHDISQIFVTGLALDFCVFATAIDGPEGGFQTFVVPDAARGISAEGMAKALVDLAANNITVLNATDIPSQSCSVIENKLPGCAVSQLNASQQDHMFSELCARFKLNYTLDPDWCLNVLDGNFTYCTPENRLNYALSVWAFFASQCCAPLQSFGSCQPFTPPAPATTTPTPAIVTLEPTNRPSGFIPTPAEQAPTPIGEPVANGEVSPTAVIVVMFAVVVALGLGLAYFFYWRTKRQARARHDMLVPLIGETK